MIYDDARFEAEQIMTDLQYRASSAFSTVNNNIKRDEDINKDDIEYMVSKLEDIVDKSINEAENKIQDAIVSTINTTFDLIKDLHESSDEELMLKIGNDPKIFEMIINPSEDVIAFYNFKTKL